MAQVPKPSSGTIKRFAPFDSKYVASRTVDVWLPAGYSPAKKYAVLYMHDGQLLFDSTHTWNNQEWQVDEVLSKLMEEGKIRECIVVGAFSIGKIRHQEYFPKKPIDLMPKAVRTDVTARLRNEPLADNYLKFLVEELKPFIDSKFSTYTDRDNTFVAGSSMGGLISMYALCEYPEVFGGAACLSTHWVGNHQAFFEAIPQAFNDYIKQKLPPPRHHRIYFDYGSETLDSLYKPHQKLVDRTMKSKGYTSAHWVTREFIGHDHSEHSWSRRLHIPMAFLLRKD